MTARNTTTRDQHRRAIARTKPPCGICGDPIDYQAHHLDPLSFTIDHITPIAAGGEDAPDNLAPPHPGRFVVSPPLSSLGLSVFGLSAPLDPPVPGARCGSYSAETGK